LLTRVRNRHPPTQVLEAVIKYRWLALPTEQREGIKNFIATIVIKARSAAPSLVARSQQQPRAAPHATHLARTSVC
jgi:hypothetical protein